MRSSRRLGLHLAVAGALIAGVAGAASSQAYTGATHTALPLFHKHDYVGKPLRIFTIVNDDGKPNKASTFDNRVIWFGHALVTSKWYSNASTAYQLGSHGTAGSIRVKHIPLIKPGVTQDTIENHLRGYLNHAHIHRNPKVRSIYVFYLPCKPGTPIGIAVCGASSYHPQVTLTAPDPNFTPGDSMVFVLMPTSHGKPVNIPVNNATVAASHEIIEATTDTNVNGTTNYILRSNEVDTPFDVSPWVFNEGGKFSQTEVGDMANGTRINLKFNNAKHGFTYQYQRFYTPFGAVHVGDPYRPLSPKVFNNATTAPGWITDSIAAGGKVQIPLRGWSTRKIKSWKLTLSEPQWSGHPSDPSTPKLCKATLDKDTINNNVVRVITVQPAAGVTPSVNDWCAIDIRSATVDPAHNDIWHQWLTGVRFVS